MLYIDKIDDYTVRISDEPDGEGNVKMVAIPIESRKEIDDRVWIRNSDNIETIINNYEFGNIVFNGETYSFAEDLVVAMNVQLGALLNLFANNTTVTANDDRNVTADGTTQSIEAWFDYMNEEFDKLYEIYT